jgi:hypothetical protein
MLPHTPQGIHALLWNLAHASYLLFLHPDTPDLLRRRLRKFYPKLKKEMPPKALSEIEAAEAKATIIAANHLRGALPGS